MPNSLMNGQSIEARRASVHRGDQADNSLQR